MERERENLSGFQAVFAIDSVDDGLFIGQWRNENSEDPRDDFYLRTKGVDSDTVQGERSRFVVKRGVPAVELENHLIKLSYKGILSRSEIFLGVSSDPFHPFDGKFDATMKLLELFRKYPPGFLHIQTRSPLIVIAMPVLKRLRGQIGVTVPIETMEESILGKFLPGLPRLDERFKAINVLRTFGIEVTAQVSPLLPYGDWKLDAPKFAKFLNGMADYVHIVPIIHGPVAMERRLKNDIVAKALSSQRLFHWLRPDADQPLREALKLSCGKKLEIPVRECLDDPQMKLFVA